jgi:hypothetical protein
MDLFLVSVDESNLRKASLLLLPTWTFLRNAVCRGKSVARGRYRGGVL